MCRDAGRHSVAAMVGGVRAVVGLSTHDRIVRRALGSPAMRIAARPIRRPRHTTGCLRLANHWHGSATCCTEMRPECWPTVARVRTYAVCATKHVVLSQRRPEGTISLDLQRLPADDHRRVPTSLTRPTADADAAPGVVQVPLATAGPTAVRLALFARLRDRPRPQTASVAGAPTAGLVVRRGPTAAPVPAAAGSAEWPSASRADELPALRNTAGAFPILRPPLARTHLPSHPASLSLHAAATAAMTVLCAFAATAPAARRCELYCRPEKRSPTPTGPSMCCVTLAQSCPVWRLATAVAGPVHADPTPTAVLPNNVRRLSVSERGVCRPPEICLRTT